MAPVKALTSIVGLQGVGTALSFAVVLSLTSILGAEGFGRYVWVLSIGSTLALFAEMGFPTTIIKRFAPLNMASVRGPSPISNSLSLYAIGTLATIIVALSLWSKTIITDRPEIIWALPVAGGLACLVLSAAVLRAAGMAIRSNTIQFIIRPILVLLGVWLIGAYGAIDPRLYLLVYTAATLGSALIFVMPLIQNSVGNWRGGGLISPVGAHFQVSIARSVSNHLPILITGFFVAPELLAYLAISIRLTSPIRFGLAAARSYYSPSINASIKNRDLVAAGQHYRYATLFSFSAALLVMVALIAVTIVLLGLQNGPLSGFDNTRLLLWVMILSAFSHLSIAIFGPVQIVAILLHEERYVRNINFFAIILFAVALIGAAWIGDLVLLTVVMILYSVGVSASLGVRVRSAFRKAAN